MRNEGKGKSSLQLWGGIECTINRLGDRFCDQFEKGGHLHRPEDLDLIANLGIRTLRYPVLWERTAPEHPDRRDWRLADDRLERLRSLEIRPIVGLVHHGSGPRYTSLVDEGFATGLAEHARAVAERFPWVDAYTPVNEPLTTARFSGLYGHWYPHGKDDATFFRALVNQVKATVLSMRAVRRINPRAQLVQTEDLGKTYATERLQDQAEFENFRRWITWDLLCGTVDPLHPLWEKLVDNGIAETELEWLIENACPPDVLGFNHYLTSERFLDHRLERYPSHTHGGNGVEAYADVEAVRVLAGGVGGARALLEETWERYRLPIAITECHLGCTREEQVRWLTGVWRQASDARESGIDVRAVTAWSLFGAHDWCSLLTKDAGEYEPGVFDLRAPDPRPTALGGVIRGLVDGKDEPSDAFAGEGWWERPIRLEYPPVLTTGVSSPAPKRAQRVRRRPILIVGARGSLGQAFARICALRGLEYRLLTREQFDLANPRSIAMGLDGEKPWAVVNAAGYADVDGAERDPTRCWRDNASGPINLAIACAARKLPLVSFSCPMVFDGTKPLPYVESDVARPLNVYGKAKASAEAATLREHRGAMVVRSGPLFGPSSRQDLLMEIVHTLTAGRPYAAACDLLVSPTFMPDLVNATLDLLQDGVTGVVHLANGGQATWAEFAQSVAEIAGLDPQLVEERPAKSLGWTAGRPSNAALASERAWVMPTLESALRRLQADLRLDDREEPGRSAYIC